MDTISNTMDNLFRNTGLIACFTVLILIFIWVIMPHPISKKKTESEEAKDKRETEESSELVQFIFSQDKPVEFAYTIFDVVLRMIDGFIENALETYFKLSAYPEDHYITSDEQKDISNYLLASVSKNMTPDVIHMISLVYNVKSDEELTKLLKLRIKLRMLEIIVNINKPME